MSFEEPLEPGGTGLLVGRRVRNHRHECGDGVVHCGADRARGAVDLLECGRDPLDERNRTLGTEHGILAYGLLDLGDSLFHALDGRLGLPAERTPAKAGLELPLVGFRLPRDLLWPSDLARCLHAHHSNGTSRFLPLAYSPYPASSNRTGSSMRIRWTTIGTNNPAQATKGIQ